jgi:hypothetical protein
MRLAVALCAFTACALASERIGDIEFFGYKGLNVLTVRSALPVHDGDAYAASTRQRIRTAVEHVLGRAPTDVAAICCNDHGDRVLFIGLSGRSVKAFAYNTAPTGDERLPTSIMDLYQRLNAALEAAVRKGGDSAQEDVSNGYSLVKDPTARALELEVRAWAVPNEAQLMRVLRHSGSVEDRRVASDALGYANASKQQIEALIESASDPDDEVRNNAARSLGVLARGKPAIAKEIEPGKFIHMLNSGIWTDRNKGASLLMQLTAARDPDLLRKIRSEALDSLIEMAQWRDSSHAYFSRVVLGRVAGTPEERLDKIAWTGPVTEIISAAESGRPAAQSF